MVVYRPRLGANFLMRFFIPRPFTLCIRMNIRLARFDLRRRKWLFRPFVRNILPLPLLRKRFAVALWVFNLYFFFFFLRGLILISLITLYCIMPKIISDKSIFFLQSAFPKPDGLHVIPGLNLNLCALDAGR